MTMEGGSFDSLPNDLREYVFNINKFMILHAQMTLTRIARGMRVRSILARARRLLRGRPLRNIPLSLQR
jgi:hypothetical protein